MLLFRRSVAVVLTRLVGRYLRGHHNFGLLCRFVFEFECLRQVASRCATEHSHNSHEQPLDHIKGLELELGWRSYFGNTTPITHLGVQPRTDHGTSKDNKMREHDGVCW